MKLALSAEQLFLTRKPAGDGSSFNISKMFNIHLVLTAFFLRGRKLKDPEMNQLIVFLMQYYFAVV